MGKPIRIFRHAELEGPGYLLEVMGRHGIPCEVVAIDHSEPVPADVDGASGLVFLGGPVDVHDHAPWIGRQVALVRQAVGRGVPVLGHGFGAELITRALGGMVVRSRYRRVGWFPVRCMDNTPSRQWLHGLAQTFDLFHCQDHAFSLPPGATPILNSQWCLIEGYVMGGVLALQGHLEVTEAMLHKWVSANAGPWSRLQGSAPPDNLTLNWDAVVQGREAITDRLADKVDALHRVADAVYGHWLSHLPR
ncbi:MAG TPA: type 1 glutamine amidotransferase [Gammaproteobacteria bacterium]|nr:type 1 glutamine amidotransferase [Gammaproteobacteria bacterium]